MKLLECFQIYKIYPLFWGFMIYSFKIVFIIILCILYIHLDITPFKFKSESKNISTLHSCKINSLFK